MMLLFFTQRLHQWGLIGLICALLMMTGGCVTDRIESSDSRPLPAAPRLAPITPADALITALVLQVGPKPQDTNNNGFPDLIEIETYLFAEPHPTPRWAAGAFIFELYEVGTFGTSGVRPIRHWRIEGEKLLGRRVKSSLFGPGYRFNLSLLEQGSDTFSLRWADLTCRFEDEDGSTKISSSGVRSIQIGSALARGR